MEFLLLWAIIIFKASCLDCTSRLLPQSSPWWVRCQLTGHAGSAVPNMAQQAAPTVVGGTLLGHPDVIFLCGTPTLQGLTSLRGVEFAPEAANYHLEIRA